MATHPSIVVWSISMGLQRVRHDEVSEHMHTHSRSNVDISHSVPARNRLCLSLLSHFSCVRLCVTPQTAAHEAPLSLGFSKQEYWSGLPFPSPMHESENDILLILIETIKVFLQTYQDISTLTAIQHKFSNENHFSMWSKLCCCNIVKFLLSR